MFGRDTYAKIMVFDVRRIPDEVLPRMFWDETTKWGTFNLYPRIAYVPADIYRGLNVYERTLWSQYLGTEAITRVEPHLKHWKDLTNVEINLGIEKLRFRGKLKELNQYCEMTREHRFNRIPVDT